MRLAAVALNLGMIVACAAAPDASVERPRILAINAIVALTGFDPRYDAGRKPRAPEVVAAEVLAACRPATPRTRPAITGS